MDLKAEKLNIIKWLENVDDEMVIRQFLILKTSNERHPEGINSDERMAIDRAIESIDAGKHITDEEVKRATRQKFPNLF